jgi:hypothetical protein
MAITSNTDLVAAFSTGKTPTGGDFQNLIDSTFSPSFSSVYTTLNSNSSNWVVGNSVTSASGAATGLYLTVVVSGSSLKLPLYK